MNRYVRTTRSTMKLHRHVCSKPSSKHRGSAVGRRPIHANKASHGKGAPSMRPHVKRAAQCSHVVKGFVKLRPVDLESLNGS